MIEPMAGGNGLADVTLDGEHIPPGLDESRVSLRTIARDE
jgi:hypothetical protein